MECANFGTNVLLARRTNVRRRLWREVSTGSAIFASFVVKTRYLSSGEDAGSSSNRVPRFLPDDCPQWRLSLTDLSGAPLEYNQP